MTTLNFEDYFPSGSATSDPFQSNDNAVTQVNFQNTPSIKNSLISIYEYITSPVLAAATFVSGTAYPIYTFPNDGTTWKVVFASVRYTVASSSGTIDIQYAPSGTAITSGTTVLASTMSTATAADTAVAASVAVSPPTISGGASLNLVSGGTQTGLVNQVVTIAIARLT